MQVHRDQGVAIRIGPESCVGIREDTGEASAGKRAGQPLSHDRKLFPGADAVCVGDRAATLAAIPVGESPAGGNCPVDTVVISGG